MNKELSYEEATEIQQALVDIYHHTSFDIYQILHNRWPDLKHIVKRGCYGVGDNVEYYTFIFKNGSQLQLHAGLRDDLEKAGL